MPQYLMFLTSTRFWAIVIFALSIWFNSLGWIPVELSNFLQLVCGGHTGLRTIDRAFEQFSKKK